MAIDLGEGDNCPKCGHHIDRATPVGHPAVNAEKGDYSVCIECASVLVFTDDKGHVRLITEEEEIKMDDETRDLLSRVQFAIKNMRQGELRP